MKMEFAGFAILIAAGLFAVGSVLSDFGDDWLMFGLLTGALILSGLLVLWRRLAVLEKKLDALLEQKAKAEREEN